MLASLGAKVRLLGEKAAMVEKPRGGHGGSVEITGGSGRAIGGPGGRGGDEGFGRGGDGGGGTHSGGGTSIGGGGGDAGRLGRPALGAASSLEQSSEFFGRPPGLSNSSLDVDCYGIYWPGRGGDSYEAEIEVRGRLYSINVILRLFRIWENDAIDCVDLMGPRSPQEWWGCAVSRFPDLCGRAISHMKSCEDDPRDPPPSPYNS